VVGRAVEHFFLPATVPVESYQVDIGHILLTLALVALAAVVPPVEQSHSEQAICGEAQTPLTAVWVKNPGLALLTQNILFLQE